VRCWIFSAGSHAVTLRVFRSRSSRRHEPPSGGALKLSHVLFSKSPPPRVSRKSHRGARERVLSARGYRARLAAERQRDHVMRSKRAGVPLPALRSRRYRARGILFADITAIKAERSSASARRCQLSVAAPAETRARSRSRFARSRDLSHRPQEGGPRSVVKPEVCRERENRARTRDAAGPLPCDFQ